MRTHFAVMTVATLIATSLIEEAYAQRQGQGTWLNVDYTYSNVSYTEELFKEKGNLAGVRGDLGIALASFLGLGVGGEYKDGNMNYTDASTLRVTKDYFRDVRGMVHLILTPIILSGGRAQREWYNDLVTSYRRRQFYNYYPIALTYTFRGAYIRAEKAIWDGGIHKRYVSDISAAQKDVTFTQSHGAGYEVEIGYTVQTAARFFTRVFLSYQRWDVQESDTQSDNVNLLTEPKNNTVIVKGGVGVSF